MNIYVGSLSRVTTEESLRQAFEQFGEVVSVRIMKDKITNEPRGFGFVEMKSDDDAQVAIEQMNGKMLDGSALRVSQARAPERRPQFGGPRPQSRFNKPPRRY